MFVLNCVPEALECAIKQWIYVAHIRSTCTCKEANDIQIKLQCSSISFPLGGLRRVWEGFCVWKCETGVIDASPVDMQGTVSGREHMGDFPVT